MRREGPTPAVIPNAGRRQEVYWMIDDAQRYAVLLRKAFPKIMFYETFEKTDDLEEKPTIRILDRLDDPTIRNHVGAFVPYDGWIPNLVRIKGPTQKLRWTWSRYLSPRLRFPVWYGPNARPAEWRTEPDAPRVETWTGTSILTSYRRELPDEGRISDRFVALARKLCIRTVPVLWKSSREFLEGDGKVARGGLLVGDGWTTPAAAAWCLAAPGRVLGFSASASGGAHGCLPVELVPDSWWGDIPKPKWAQRP